MKPEEQRIAIAEACGWKYSNPDPNDLVDGFEGFVYYEVNGIGYESTLLNDLNAMHEAEKVLTTEQDGAYRAQLANLFSRACGYEWDDGYAGAITATAAQRAEAFLRTLGKWVE